MKNYAGLTGDFADYNKSKIVILPIPFDETSTWLKGADKGPEAVIEASCNMEVYDIETEGCAYEKGIHTANALDVSGPEKMVEESYTKVRGFLEDGKFVVSLGGEHSVSIGPMKAHGESFRDMSILHLDAHADMRESYDGQRYSHACVMARARELTDKTVSVGVRSMDSTEVPNSGKILCAHEIHDSKSWIKEVPKSLSKNVYVTIDLDVFDSGIMPSTGTPEPGGLGWYDVTRLLKNVAEKRNIVGFDVVELCPTENKAPDFLAAKLIYKLLSYKFI